MMKKKILSPTHYRISKEQKCLWHSTGKRKTRKKSKLPNLKETKNPKLPHKLLKIFLKSIKGLTVRLLKTKKSPLEEFTNNKKNVKNSSKLKINNLRWIFSLSQPISSTSKYKISPKNFSSSKELISKNGKTFSLFSIAYKNSVKSTKSNKHKSISKKSFN